MPQVLRPESIGAISKVNNTQISIAPSNLIVGGQQYSTSTITVSTAATGINGLDVGSISANQFYYIYVVKSGISVGAVLSLNTAPTGFSAYRLVGQCTTQVASTNLEAANKLAQEDAPIGHIVAAMLTEPQFRAIHGSGWVLADGRGVAGSKYASITGAGSIPDIRGVALRAANNGGSTLGARTDGNQNPVNRNIGDFESDQTGLHTHDSGTLFARIGIAASGNIYQDLEPSVPSWTSDRTSSGAVISNLSISTGTTVGGSTANSNASTTESRVKNITVNYFIKIN